MAVMLLTKCATLLLCCIKKKPQRGIKTAAEEGKVKKVRALCIFGSVLT